mmetsp:Transcript_18461/g.46086  ORF Transcript_18461/g.46086 Transcript_18461/m.46086 type:complete len:234 (+) Transcript_18461:964-1665(+)
MLVMSCLISSLARLISEPVVLRRPHKKFLSWCSISILSSLRRTCSATSSRCWSSFRLWRITLISLFFSLSASSSALNSRNLSFFISWSIMRCSTSFWCSMICWRFSSCFRSASSIIALRFIITWKPRLAPSSCCSSLRLFSRSSRACSWFCFAVNAAILSPVLSARFDFERAIRSSLNFRLAAMSASLCFVCRFRISFLRSSLARISSSCRCWCIHARRRRSCFSSSARFLAS